MKIPSVIRTSCLSLAGLILFFLTLEVGGWLLIRMGHRFDVQGPSYTINSWTDVEEEARKTGRNSELAKILLNWKLRYPILSSPRQVDLNLKEEPPLYSNRGLRTGKMLFSGHSRLSPGIDDIYVLKGARSGKEKYRAHYKTDDFGRRTTGTEGRPGATRNILFLGCSFTFGEGVNQGEAFPSKVGQVITDARVYNLGVPGSSPSSLYYRMMSEKDFPGPDVDPGLPTTVVFTFIDDHMRRVVGTSQFLSRGDYEFHSTPYVYLDDGILRTEETFASRWTSFRWLYRVFGKTHFSRATNLEVPWYTEYHYRLLSVIFREMKAKLKARFPKLEFYVSFYPWSSFYIDELSNHFAQESIPSLGYSKINQFNLSSGHETHGTDSHPSALAHDLYSLFLLYDLSRI